MKKILLFSLAYYPRNVSGAEGAVQEITNRIPPQDIEFHMVTLRFDATDATTEKIENIHVHRVGTGGSYTSKILFPFLAARAACALDRTEHFDALWALMTYMLIPVVLARMMGLRLPYVLTLQDGDPYKKVFGRARIIPFIPLINSGFRRANVVQVISRYLSGWPKLRGSSAPVVLVYNGANPRDIKNTITEEEITAVEEKLGKKQGDVFLVNTSRLVHQKGSDTTIRALPLLPENIKLVLVGAGEDEHMLKDLAQSLGVGSRVIFTGQVDRNVVTAYRRACDIFVAPSRSEGLGNAFISALASRLPLVATQVGGMADYVFDEAHNPHEPATAWVVEPDKPEQIAEKVKEILANPEKAKSISEYARRMVEEKYDWDNIAKQMREEVFSKVL